MGRRKCDLIGHKFGLLTVIEDLGYKTYGESKQRQRILQCQCDCGNPTIVTYSNLIFGLTKSCGCLRNNNGGRPTKGNEIKFSTIENKDVALISSSNTDDVIVVDKDKWDKLKQYTWHVNAQGYAATNINGKIKLMHHLIIPNVPNGYERDHINRNRLDNRMDNLRVVTKQENLKNRRFNKHTPYECGNICWYEPSKEWLVYAKENNKIINIGLFKNKDDAIAVKQQIDIDSKKVA